MNHAVFYSLFALDAYNRGANPGIYGLSESGQIGTYTIRPASSAERAGWDAVNFYAVAYTGGGETVISYRGTDDLGLTTDIWNGWALGLGFSSASQAGLAIQFYQDVSGGSLYDGSGGSIVTVGHSLGGGLAGFVGSLAHGDSYVFDHMPFGMAALSQSVSVALGRAIGATEVALGQELSVEDLITYLPLGSDGHLGAAYNVFIDTFTHELNYLAPDLTSATGYHLEGEVLESVRSLNAEILGLDANLLPILLNIPILDSSLQPYLLGSLATEALVNENVVSNEGTDLTASDLHSQALLTTFLFGQLQWSAEEGGGSTWEQAIAFVAPSLLSDSIGAAVGLNEGAQEEGGTGASNPGQQLATMIAYSLVNEGEMPFGNTAIRALFNDMDDLGKIVIEADPNLEPTRWLDEIVGIERLGSILTEYAALLAFHKVEQSALQQSLDGVLTLSENEDAFYVDLTGARWTLGGELAEPHDITTAHELARDMLSTGLMGQGVSEGTANFIVGNLNDWLKGRGADDVDQAVDTVSVTLTGSNLYHAEVSERYHLSFRHGGTDDSTFIQLVGGPQIVFSGNDAGKIIGTDGDDAFFGGGNGDIFAGGDGDDWFFSGGGDDVVWGDEIGNDKAGRDTFVVAGQPGTTIVSYSDGALSVNANNGTTELHHIEDVFLESGQTVFNVSGNIEADVDLTVHNGSSGIQIINAVRYNSGVTVWIDEDGEGTSGHLLDTVTGGKININGFNTEILGTDFNDRISDFSNEAKVVNAGGGHDIISVDGGNSIVFAGSGDDDVLGGNGDDIIIDHNSDYLYGSIASGSGNDSIVVSSADSPLDTGYNLEWGFGPYGIFASFPRTDPPEYTNYWLNPGAGNDSVSIDAYGSAFTYEYSAGDGQDVVSVDTYVDPHYSDDKDTNSTYLSAPTFLFDLSDYALSDITITFEYNSAQIIWENLPNKDGPPVWLLEGDYVIAFSDGGQIRLENMFELSGGGFDYRPVFSDGDYIDYDDPPEGSFYSLFIRTSDSSGEYFSALGDFVPLSQSSSSTVAAIAAPMQSQTVLSSGDDEVTLGAGGQNYAGGAGVDRLIVSWDVNAISATLDAGVLSIFDSWGVIAPSSFSEFEEIYVVSLDETYTPEEFVSFLAQGGEQTGTESSDVLHGTGSRDVLFGLGGDDILEGFGGNDTLDAGLGLDVLIGGSGDDRYIIRESSDAIMEQVGEGHDVVEAWSDYTLPDNVEDLTLIDEAVSGTGNSMANRIIGRWNDNVLQGLEGDDVLLGREGNDTLLGGSGRDRLDGGDGDDELMGGDGSDILIGGEGMDILTGGAGDDSYYVGGLDTVEELAGGGYDTVYSSAAYFDGAPFIERIRLLDGALEASAAVQGSEIIGNSADNILFGREGQDHLYGGSGDDALIGGSGNDLIVGRGHATLADLGEVITTEDAVPEFDIAVFFGDAEDFEVTALGNGWFSVEDFGEAGQTGAGEGIDYLVNIDALEFVQSDGTLVSRALSSAGLMSADAPLESDEAGFKRILDDRSSDDRWLSADRAGSEQHSPTRVVECAGRAHRPLTLSPLPENPFPREALHDSTRPNSQPGAAILDIIRQDLAAFGARPFAGGWRAREGVLMHTDWFA